MKDVLFKLKVLIYDFKSFLMMWKEQVWDVDLDEIYCCNGHMCGCMATTKREQIMYSTFNVNIRSQKFGEK